MSVGTLTREMRRPLMRDAAPGARGSSALLIVGGLTLLGGVLRFYGLGHQGFWFDEGNTALLVHLSPGHMIGLIPQSESTPPLYYCVAWVWARIFGYGEAGLRSLSAVAGTLTVPVAFAAADRLISRRAAVIAAALTACSPLLIWYSQEARSYSLLVLLTGVALLAFAHAKAVPSRRALIAWVLACALAMATHYYAVLAVVPQAVWLLLAHRRRRAVLLAIAAVAACGLALIPLALSQNATGNASWIAPIPLGSRLGQIIPQFLLGTGSPAPDVLEPIAAAMVMVAAVLLALRAEAFERRASLAVGALALGGLALNLIFVAAGTDDLITRNVIALWLPAAIAVAGGLGARRAGVIGALAAAVICATGVVAAIGVASQRNLQRPDWRGVARVLGPRPQASRVILIQHYRDLLPLSLYIPGLKFWRHGASEKVAEIDVIAISAPRVKLCWWGAACNLSPTAIQNDYPLRGFHRVSLGHAYQFTIMRLVAPHPTTVSRTDIAGALSATTLGRDELLIQRP